MAERSSNKHFILLDVQLSKALVTSYITADAEFENVWLSWKKSVMEVEYYLLQNSINIFGSYTQTAHRIRTESQQRQKLGQDGHPGV